MADNLSKKHLIIVGFGPVTWHKYSHFILASLKKGDIDSYSIVDLESQKTLVLRRIKNLPVPPETVFFISDSDFDAGSESGIRNFDRFCKAQTEKHRGELKIFIATEPQAHEIYVRYCIENEIDSLVTKPIILPMRNGQFYPSQLASGMAEIVRRAEMGKAQHAVLCWSRDHEVFEKNVRQPIESRMDELQTPITSFHLKTGGSVWNLLGEFERENHSYKYGYGMLMHGGYHYVDLMAIFLRMNKRVYPDQEFILDINSYSAHPHDQAGRISRDIDERLDGFKHEQLGILPGGKLR